jgi:hypothetical protein
MVAGLLPSLPSFRAAAQEPGATVAVPAVPVNEHAMLRAAPGWPLWLKDYRTRQRTDRTSAIAYAGRDSAGGRCFFLADAVGAVHFLRVTEPAGTEGATLSLEPVGFDRSLLDALSEHERWDFQALALEIGEARVPARDAIADSLTGVLSVAGHGAQFAELADLLRVRFERVRRQSGAMPARWQVAAEGPWLAGARFWEPFVFPGGGITGIGLAPHYTYLGLARLVPPGELNVRGTMIFLYDPSRGRVAQVITRRLEINSIGGMHALADSALALVDRDRQALDIVRWNPLMPGQVSACDRFPLELLAPGGVRYAIPAVEGMTIDEQGDLWCVVAPDPQNYRALEPAAAESLHVYLAAGIPILYRFPGERVWQEVGLDALWRPRP